MSRQSASFFFMAAASSEKSKNENWCTACSEGLWKLVLRQINAEEAVYVCENPDCTYPVGYEVDFIKRPVPGLSGKKETQESVRLTEASFKKLGEKRIIENEYLISNQGIICIY